MELPSKEKVKPSLTRKEQLIKERDAAIQERVKIINMRRNAEIEYNKMIRETEKQLGLLLNKANSIDATIKGLG